MWYIAILEVEWGGLTLSHVEHKRSHWPMTFYCFSPCLNRWIRMLSGNFGSRKNIEYWLGQARRGSCWITQVFLSGFLSSTKPSFGGRYHGKYLCVSFSYAFLYIVCLLLSIFSFHALLTSVIDYSIEVAIRLSWLTLGEEPCWLFFINCIWILISWEYVVGC